MLYARPHVWIYRCWDMGCGIALHDPPRMGVASADLCDLFPAGLWCRSVYGRLTASSMMPTSAHGGTLDTVNHCQTVR